eukprot:4553620-Alexandrium_andersonii.AAC.1
MVGRPCSGGCRRARGGDRPGRACVCRRLPGRSAGTKGRRRVRRRTCRARAEHRGCRCGDALPPERHGLAIRGGGGRSECSGE